MGVGVSYERDTSVGLVITDMLAKMQLLGDMHVVTIDTLHLFPETYKLVAEVPSPTLHPPPPLCFLVLSLNRPES